MTKFSKGVWVFRKHCEDSQWFGNIICNYGKVNNINTIRTITCHTTYGTPEENEANAVLTSSAYDLYFTLDKALKYIKSIEKNQDVYPYEVIVPAEKLLTKIKKGKLS